MSIRGRLSRLERKAKVERRRTPVIDPNSPYANDVALRRAKLAEIDQADPWPEPDPGERHPRDRHLWHTLDNYIKACERRREQGR